MSCRDLHRAPVADWEDLELSCKDGILADEVARLEEVAKLAAGAEDLLLESYDAAHGQ